MQVRTVARNGMEGGFTERHINIQTRLTEPQGKLKESISSYTPLPTDTDVHPPR